MQDAPLCLGEPRLTRSAERAPPAAHHAAPSLPHRRTGTRRRLARRPRSAGALQVQLKTLVAAQAPRRRPEVWGFDMGPAAMAGRLFLSIMLNPAPPQKGRLALQTGRPRHSGEGGWLQLQHVKVCTGEPLLQYHKFMESTHVPGHTEGSTRTAALTERLSSSWAAVGS